MTPWHNCPNLTAFWFNVSSAVVYIYALYSSGSRYRSTRIKSNDPRYGQDWNETYTLLHLSAILTSSLFWLLLAFSSMIKTGSLANDYVEMGLSSTAAIVGKSHITWSADLTLRKILSRLKYHFIPFNSMTHLCGAFLLLLPIPILVKQDIDHGIYSTDTIYGILSVYTPEIINFVLGAISLTVRLPTVFLYASTQISVIFSFILFIANLNILIRSILHQLLPLQNFPYNLIKTEIVDVVLFVLTLGHFSMIYEMARTRYIDVTYVTKLGAYEQSSPKSAINSTGRPKLLRFWPNILSTLLLIVSLVLSIDQYRLSSRMMPTFYIDLIINMIHFLNWLIIVLLFTFKTDWHFRVLKAPLDRIPNRKTSLQLPNLSLKPVDPIYTCFQQLECVRSVSSESSRNHNHDYSSSSSSSGSHASERALAYKVIPSISNQIEVPELNYEDLHSYKTVSRYGKNCLKEITEENTEQIGYFKSPNISQRSSNLHSSDSGIGVNSRDITDSGMLIKFQDPMIARSRSLNVPRHVKHDYDIDEEFMESMNICSDV